MNINSLSIEIQPNDKPHVHFGDPTLTEHKHIAVYLDRHVGSAHIVAWEPASLFALADALLSAGQQFEAALEAKAARAVNEANAATDAQPFGTLPVAS